MPTERPRRFEPITVSVTTSIRRDLQRIADRETLSLSDVARRAFMAEIERDRDDESHDDA